MEKEKHTPTPWHSKEMLCIGGPAPVLIGNDGLEICAMYAGQYNGKANAAFIVRAVNCHAELVEALSNARSMLATLAGDPRQTIQQDGSILGDEIQAALLDTIDAALSKALGTEDR